ncbi:MAG TPA: N-acetyl-gamma-glutamyl-phosphate reductase [Erythrobacter sp.]|nr:N-acetyl-gamma-glutamyl-phosphate reductase [Erythrobacter sp.]
MPTKLFIDGAAGTTGIEIRDRLNGREEFDLIILGDEERKADAARLDALHSADIAILCLPDDAARAAVEFAEGSDTRIIDASSAHRVAEGWTYGFPELVGHEAVANAKLVSNPGCYPTGFLALVAPLVRAGLLPADWPYTVNAVSGYSGGGKALIERFEAEDDIGFRAYGLELEHKHRPEMKHHAGLTHGVIFAPSVVRAYRGMLVEVPLHLGVISQDLTADRLLGTLREFYANSPVIAVNDGRGNSELLLKEDAPPSDMMELYVFGNEGGYHARLIAVLDNLGKGAGGAAIQNLNIMCGLPEIAGLRI